MDKHLDSLRALAAKNARLLHAARQTDDALVASSHAEIDRLGKVIAATKHGDAITDPATAIAYNRNVHQRAALLRRVGDS